MSQGDVNMRNIYSSLCDGNRADATIVHVCAARESVMSERAATADRTEATDHLVTQTQAEEPALAADLLVEEVSIDGMCGVY
jgi:mycofactocin precursor